MDPLDGTREFIKRNGEFTVNIALVQHGEPVLGVVYAPVREIAWVGLAEPGPVPVGAWTLTAEALALLQADDLSPAPTGATPAGALTRTVQDVGTPIAVRTPNPDQITIIASRTHMNDATREFIDRIAAGGEIYQADPARGHASVPLRYNKENLLNPWFVVRAW